MAEERDYLGEKLRLVERAREDAYFRRLDQELLTKMRQQDAAAVAASQALQGMFTPVLVPVDFSPHAAEALRYAVGIADRFSASLIVLHVIRRELLTHATRQHLGSGSLTASGAFGATETSELPTQEAEEVVVDLRERAYVALQNFLPPQLAKHQVELRVVVGQPFERILETAVHEQVGLMVMGTHGRTGLVHVVMGSVAERVVRLAPCPVLTVKAPTPEEKSWLQGFYETFIPSS